MGKYWDGTYFHKKGIVFAQNTLTYYSGYPYMVPSSACHLGLFGPAYCPQHYLLPNPQSLPCHVSSGTLLQKQQG